MLVDNVEKGMLPMSIYELMVQQSGRRDRTLGSETERTVAERVDSAQLVQRYIVDTAQFLGIDVDDYPALRRAVQQAWLLQVAAAGGMPQKFQEAFEKAWGHLAAAAA